MNLIQLILYAQYSLSSKKMEGLFLSMDGVEDDKLSADTRHYISSAIRKINDENVLKSMTEDLAEQKFLNGSLSLIQRIFLDEEKGEDILSILLLIKNFPNLEIGVIEKKRVGISFLVMFIRFLFYTDEAKNVYKDLEQICATEVVETNYLKFEEIVKDRIKSFISLVPTLLRQSDISYYKLRDCQDLYLHDATMAEGVYGTFKKLSEHVLTEEKKNNYIVLCETKECKALDSNIESHLVPTGIKEYNGRYSSLFYSFTYLCLSSFCTPFTAVTCTPTDLIRSLEFNNAPYVLANNLEIKIPCSGTIKLSSSGFGLIVLDLLSLFTFYSCENLKINLSINEDKINISYKVERNTLDFIIDNQNVDINRLIYLNKIAHRDRQEFTIHDLCIENLSNTVECIVSKSLGILKGKGKLIRLSRKEQNHCMLDRVRHRPTVEYCIKNNMNPEYIDKSRYNSAEISKSLLVLVKDFLALTDKPEIRSFLERNRELNKADLRGACHKEGICNFTDILDIFFSYQCCGYNEKAEEKCKSYKEKLDKARAVVDILLEKIKNNSSDIFKSLSHGILSILNINIYTETSLAKIKLKLLLCIALCNDKTEEHINYESMKSLRTHLQGVLTNKTSIREVELAETIITTIKMNRLKSALLVKYCMKQIYHILILGV